MDGHSRLEYPIGHVLYESGGWISNIRFSPQHDKIAFMDHPALWDNRGSAARDDLTSHVTTLSGEWNSRTRSGLAARRKGNLVHRCRKGQRPKPMAVNLSGKVRTLLDLPVGITLQDISPDGRVLVR